MKPTHTIVSRFIAVLAALALSSTMASATLWNLSANLSGLQEVPPNPSPAFGSVTLTLDDSTGVVTLTSGFYNFLLGPITGSHIHGLAGPGVNAGVLIPLGNTGGTTGMLVGGGVLSPANVAGMLAGKTYVNVHSTVLPGGEIRGQLTVVPEPSALALCGLGALALIGRLRARR